MNSKYKVCAYFVIMVAFILLLLNTINLLKDTMREAANPQQSEFSKSLIVVKGTTTETAVSKVTERGGFLNLSSTTRDSYSLKVSYNNKEYKLIDVGYDNYAFVKVGDPYYLVLSKDGQLYGYGVDKKTAESAKVLVR